MRLQRDAAKRRAPEACRSAESTSYIMPIKIYKMPDKEELAWLCDDVWTLPPQIKALHAWLKRQKKLNRGDYIADVGFQWYQDASGGGSIISTEMMNVMSKYGITLFLSEYPGFAEKKKRKRRRT
jgi:hypothetical protein